MTDYVKRMKEHLERYRDERLGVQEDGVHKSTGRPYPHILPEHLRWLNVHEPYRKEVRAHVDDPENNVSLHRDFHHLNSSQAFAFNLFFPFFHDEFPKPLLEAMGLSGGAADWQLERVPYREEGTNVDACWRDARGQWTYCEVKLTESAFGAAKDDERHLEKYRDIYSEPLEPYWGSVDRDPKNFFRNYQIFRNLWLGAKEPQSTIVFLLPRASAKPWDAVHGIVGKMDVSLSRRVKVVAVEDVLDRLGARSDLPQRLAMNVEQLREKYLPT
ncbi:MAG: hypothetical protein EA398_15175 [Deltaproteobacteria bacterium]|nr:MAG: hypothetical protein EA398_15175 [Deltaproteobacteria bacterium]